MLHPDIPFSRGWGHLLLWEGAIVAHPYVVASDVTFPFRCAVAKTLHNLWLRIAKVTPLSLMSSRSLSCRATKSQVHEKAGAGAAGGGGALGVATAMDSVSLMSMADMRDEVITLLLPEETVVQALRRLGARPRESRPG